MRLKSNRPQLCRCSLEVKVLICIFLLMLLNILVIIWIGYSHIKKKTKYNPLLDLISCDDVSLKLEIEERGKYWIFHNYVRANRTFRCHETLTLATCCSASSLWRLDEIAFRWKAPISVAIIVSKDNLQKILSNIAYMRICKYFMKEFVSFHLVFETGTLQDIDTFPISIEEFYTDWYNCMDGPPYQSNLKNEVFLDYPHKNILRNVAIKSAQTYFVLPLDIEVVPNFNISETFFASLRHKFKYRLPKRMVFGIPTLEIEDGYEYIDNKNELRNLMAENKAADIITRKFPKYSPKHSMSDWFNFRNITYKLDELKENEMLHPYFIRHRTALGFLENIPDDLAYYKSQEFIMCLQYYRYMVLNDVFLLVSRNKQNTLNYESSEIYNKDYIKRNLITVYGSRNSCYF